MINPSAPTKNTPASDMDEQTAAALAAQTQAHAPELTPAEPPLTPDQLGEIADFQASEAARSANILAALCCGRTESGMATVAPAYHATAPQTLAGPEDAVTTLEKSLASMTDLSGRQERFIMLGDPVVASAFWAKLSQDGLVGPGHTIETTMEKAMGIYRQAARELGVEVAGLAKFTAKRSGYAGVIPGFKDHQIMVMGSGTSAELAQLGNDVDKFTKRLVNSDIVHKDNITHRAGQDYVTISSNLQLQRLITDASAPVIRQRAADQAARDAAENEKTGGKSDKTEKTANSQPTAAPAAASAPAPAPAPAQAETPAAPAAPARITDADRSKIEELNQIFSQPWLPTQIRGGPDADTKGPGVYNLTVMSRALELHTELGGDKLRNPEIPASLSLRVSGGMAALSEVCEKAVGQGDHFGLSSSTPIVKAISAQKNELRDNFKVIAESHGMPATLDRGAYADRFYEVASLLEEPPRSRTASREQPEVQQQQEVSRAAAAPAEKAPDSPATGLPAGMPKTRDTGRER